MAVAGFAAALPFPPWGSYAGLARLPLWFYNVLPVLVLSYLLIVQIVKTIFSRLERKNASAHREVAIKPAESVRR